MITEYKYLVMNSFFKKKNFSKFLNYSFLITGGTGILGYSLLVLLKKIGFKNLYCLTSSDPSLSHTIENVKYHKMDLRKIKNFKNNFDNYDYIIHSAGYAQPNKFLNDPIGVFNINVDATRLLINKCRRGFGFISSSEIYSGNKGKLDEQSSGITNPQHKRACYIESKRSGEFLTKAIALELNLDAKSFRVSNAYGPGYSKNDNRVITDFIRNAILNKTINVNAGANQVRKINYNFDAAQKIIIALLFGKENVYNISGGNKITIGDMAKIIAKITGASYKISLENDQTGAPDLVDIFDKNFITEFNFNVESDFTFIIKQSIDWFKKVNT
jgi:nucleoside-diphosphate-sugar epimerase